MDQMVSVCCTVETLGVLLSCTDATRRQERLRGLLATIQSDVRAGNVSRRARTTAAFATITTTTTTVTTAAADNDDDDDIGDGSSVVGGPFVSRNKAMSFTSTRRRSRGRRSVLRQGIVCECCVHSCSLVELQGYCGSTPTN